MVLHGRQPVQRAVLRGRRALRGADAVQQPVPLSDADRGAGGMASCESGFEARGIYLSSFALRLDADHANAGVAVTERGVVGSGRAGPDAAQSRACAGGIPWATRRVAAMAGERTGAAADGHGAAPVYQVRSAKHRGFSAAAAGLSGRAVDLRLQEPGGGDGLECTRRFAAGDAGNPGAGLSELRYFPGGRHGGRRVCRASSRQDRGDCRAPCGRRAGKADRVPATAGPAWGDLARHFGLDLTPDDMERLRQAATLDAKHPEAAF